MGKQPLVSCVVATYNMAHFVAPSIQSTLDQTYKNLEVIVIDDGSTDDTRSVVKQFLHDARVKYQYQENQGHGAAKNAGLRLAQGELVGFNDADDIWYPSKLEKQVPLFDAAGEVGVVYSERDWIDEHGKQIPVHPVRRYRGANLSGKMLIGNFVPFSTLVITRETFEQHGYFDVKEYKSVDYDLLLRYSVHYKFDFVPEPLAAHRVWSGQMSKDKAFRNWEIFAMQERFLREHPGLVDPKEVAEGWASKYVSRGRNHARQKRRGKAFGDYLRAIKHRPRHVMAYKSILKLLFGRV